MGIKIALIGFGGIGNEIVRNINENSFKSLCTNIEICKILSEESIYDLKDEVNDNLITNDIEEIINDESIQIIVDLNKNIKKEYLLKAIEKKKDIITIDSLLLCKLSNNLKEKAEELNVKIKYSGSISFGLSILEENIGCKNIKEFYGIIDDVSNNILTVMEKYKFSLNDAISFCKDKFNLDSELGYKNGVYSKIKLGIIGNFLLNTNIKLDDIYVEGIENIKNIDLEYAKKLDMKIKPLSILKIRDDKVEARVHPVMIEKNHKLSNINGLNNAMLVKYNDYDEFMISGSNVNNVLISKLILKDILNISMQKDILKNNKVKTNIANMSGTYNKYYIRMEINNKPEAIGEITSILGEHDINIEFIDKVTIREGNEINLVLVTNECKEIQIIDAIDYIYELKGVTKIKNIIRIENFK